MKNLLKDKNGNANVILLGIMTCIMGFGMLTIGSYLYFSIATVADSGQITIVDGVAAYGQYTFSGINVTQNETATITYGSAVYIFEFNTTAFSTCQGSANCILVEVPNINTSLGASTKLVSTINANASTAALVFASLVGNDTYIAALSEGTDGNSIVLSDATSAITSSGLANGAAAVTGQAAQTALNDYVVIVFPLFGLALLVLGFSVILFTLRGSFGAGEKR